MNIGLLAQIGRTFGLLSLLSIGGANATIPEIHREVVGLLHWMDDATFVNLIAIAQAAPGPNVLIVSMIGWHMAGGAGLLVATLAVVLPSSLLALGIGRAVNRFAAVAWINVARKALAPIAIGFMLASGYVMSRAAYVGPLSIGIVAGGAALILTTRKSPLLAIGLGALIGIFGNRLAMFGL